MPTPPVFLININMESDRCWYELNIDTSTAFRQGYALPAVNGCDEVISWVHRDEIFNALWISHLHNKGIDITGALIFWRPAWFTNSRAHMDGALDQSVIFGLNWVIGGKNSEMAWYHAPSMDRDPEHTYSGLPYSSWPISSLVERDRHQIQARMTMVRVDVPHAIFVKEEPRWCISARTKMVNIPWNDRVDFMREKGLIVDDGT